MLNLEHAKSHEGEKDLTLVDLLAAEDSVELSAELQLRELRSYLRNAIRLLPDRYRLVVVGTFLEGRTAQELADFLGVTASRISQLRSEALLMLRKASTPSTRAGRPIPPGEAVELHVARPRSLRELRRRPRSLTVWRRSI